MPDDAGSDHSRIMGLHTFQAPLLLAEVSVLVRLATEGRDFSPAEENRPLVGALAPEAALLQGLKAP